MKKFRSYVGFVLGVTLLVIVWGAFVRASGSGAGCGEHWPLCNGQVLQRSPTWSTVIELTHRMTSGLSLLLVVGVVVAACRVFRPGAPARRFAWLTLFFMLTEAAVGAGLVLLRLVADDSSALRAVVLGVHLVNTLFLLGAMTATALAARAGPGFLLWRREDRARAWVLFSLLLVVGVAGAITALGDTLFPAGTLAAGLAADADPLSHFLVRLRVIHPVLALLTLVFAFFTWLRLEPRNPGAARAGHEFVALLGIQTLIGLLNIWLLAPVAMQLVHLLVADLIWIAAVRWWAARAMDGGSRAVRA